MEAGISTSAFPIQRQHVSRRRIRRPAPLSTPTTASAAKTLPAANKGRGVNMEPGYHGTGMWVRIQHRFGPRMMEWFMAGHLIAFGWVLLLPSQTFNQPAFMGFNEIVPSENFLGWIMFVIGCLRIIGLVINGARKTVTPQIRQISAGAGCLVWAGIAYAFASSGVISTWIAIYPLFAVGELVNIHRAAHDQGEVRNGKIG